MNTTLSQRAEPSSEVLFQEVGGEAVLLNLESERYFGLDPVGTRIWALLGEDSHLQHAHATLCIEYDVPAATLETDLLALIDQLADAGLVTVS